MNISVFVFAAICKASYPHPTQYYSGPHYQTPNTPASYPHPTQYYSGPHYQTPNTPANYPHPTQYLSGLHDQTPDTPAAKQPSTVLKLVGGLAGMFVGGLAGFACY